MYKQETFFQTARVMNNNITRLLSPSLHRNILDATKSVLHAENYKTTTYVIFRDVVRSQRRQEEIGEAERKVSLNRFDKKGPKISCGV